MSDEEKEVQVPPCVWLTTDEVIVKYGYDPSEILIHDPREAPKNMLRPAGSHMVRMWLEADCEAIAKGK